ncbi:peptide deformylase [Abditibacterium utsteinense]|uniref:Peptide deformylase n=1 Tax=Abditibacterium utsteinense TaxID=1960156 RepID=A0A2S8STL2_9BACT|nr:peptide deformylase [Abditibacterium utsteinense]PQV64137.1 peptide deformylase [Abditibacterium utsteinense]
MIRDIIFVPDKRLNTPCERVTHFDESLRELAQDLEETMRGGVGSVGVAAPQIGAMQCVTVVDTSNHRKFGADSQGFFTLINPCIIAREGERMGREGCMSLPDFTANVRRAARVLVRFQDLQAEWKEVWCEDFEAVAMQHEIDHLDGILFLDRVSNLQTDVFPRKANRK